MARAVGFAGKFSLSKIQRTIMPYLDAESLQELNTLPRLPEHVFLEGERALEAEMNARNKTRRVLQRALHGFVLLQDGNPIYVVPFELPDTFWEHVRVVGYAASLLGDAGLCAQTGNWPDRSVKPVLISIDKILSLDSRSDSAFRQGQQCLWLRSSGYEYALMDPFAFFQSHWGFTRAGYLAPAFHTIDLNDVPPTWWPAEKRSIWAQLKTDQRFASLPEARKKMLLEYASTRPGRSPFEPQPLYLEQQRYEKGKRSAGEMAKDERFQKGVTISGGQTSGDTKRSRLEAQDISAFMNESCSLQDHGVPRPQDISYNQTNLFTGPWGMENPCFPMLPPPPSKSRG